MSHLYTLSMLMPSTRLLSLHCILEDHFLLIFWPCHPNSQFHALQAKIHAISFLSQDHKYFKMLHQPLPIVCTAWFCLLWKSVFMLCYSYCYRLNGENAYSWEKQKSLNFKRQVTHMLSSHLTICISVFIVVCTIGWISKVKFCNVRT
jgi:hypothetical protein